MPCFPAQRAKALLQLKIKSALIKRLWLCASKARAKVVFPAPLGPAMMMTVSLYQTWAAFVFACVALL